MFSNETMDKFIETCESSMIEYDTDLYLDETTLEGVNLDVAKLVRADEVKEARRLVKEAKKMKKRKEFDEAISNLKDALKLISAMKAKVDSMPEPPSRSSKFLSYFTPLFTLMPTDEITGVKFIPTYTAGNNGGMGYTIEIQSTTYKDKMSDETTSSVKRNLQYKFNLFIKNVNATIKIYQEEKRFYLNKIKGKEKK